MNLRLWVLLSVVALSSSAAAQSEFTTSSLPAEHPAIEALEHAYPQWISVSGEDGDTILTVRGRVFTWAHGRLLPPSMADRWQEFAAQPFYPYPHDVPDVASWSDERVAEIEARLADRRGSAVRRSSGFFDALWGIHGEADADDAVQTLRFLGFKVNVHNALAGPLARVEARLSSRRAGDPSLDRFLKGLSRLEGYNWRDIAETQSRSNHAYGIAIDIIPRSYEGRIPYWLWAPQNTAGWYKAAWANRWVPHPAVVEAFEAEGFIWGGKWVLFDTIHFEYRPEILILNGMR